MASAPRLRTRLANLPAVALREGFKYHMALQLQPAHVLRPAGTTTGVPGALEFSAPFAWTISQLSPLE